MCYDKNKHFTDADKLYTTMQQSAKTINMELEEPMWFELDREDNSELFKEMLHRYIK